MLTFQQIENGEISGHLDANSSEISGHREIRIIVENRKQKKSKTQILSSGAFTINITEILPMLKTIPHPEHTKFVASKRGKKFYPIDSPNAFLISVKNRIFFVTEQEARERGLRKH